MNINTAHRAGLFTFHTTLNRSLSLNYLHLLDAAVAQRIEHLYDERKVVSSTLTSRISIGELPFRQRELFP